MNSTDLAVAHVDRLTDHPVPRQVKDSFLYRLFLFPLKDYQARNKLKDVKGWKHAQKVCLYITVLSEK